MKFNGKKLREHSTDSVTPPQLGLKQPPSFVVPESQKGVTTDAHLVTVEIEYYDVLYTRHIT